jgi:hypothetical protein
MPRTFTAVHTMLERTALAWTVCSDDTGLPPYVPGVTGELWPPPVLYVRSYRSVVRAELAKCNGGARQARGEEPPHASTRPQSASYVRTGSTERSCLSRVSLERV